MTTDHLAAARARAAELRANGATIERLDPVERAKRNPTSLRAAITAKCWQCCGSGQDPNTRQTIRECECTSCPLHALRPYQREMSASGAGAKRPC